MNGLEFIGTSQRRPGITGKQFVRLSNDLGAPTDLGDGSVCRSHRGPFVQREPCVCSVHAGLCFVVAVREALICPPGHPARGARRSAIAWFYPPRQTIDAVQVCVWGASEEAERVRLLHWRGDGSSPCLQMNILFVAEEALAAGLVEEMACLRA